MRKSHLVPRGRCLVVLAALLAACTSSNNQPPSDTRHDSSLDTVKADGLASHTDALPDIVGGTDKVLLPSDGKGKPKDLTPDIIPAGDGGLEKTCTAINKAYVAAVSSAKKCSAMLPVIQCTLKTKDKLDCPCDTFVETANTTAIATLKALATSWQNLNCSSLGWICPAVACKNPASATCTSSSSGDVCVDQ
jgi:hypothetical protein